MLRRDINPKFLVSKPQGLQGLFICLLALFQATISLSNPYIFSFSHSIIVDRLIHRPAIHSGYRFRGEYLPWNARWDVDSLLCMNNNSDSFRVILIHLHRFDSLLWSYGNPKISGAISFAATASCIPTAQATVGYGDKRWWIASTRLKTDPERSIVGWQ